MFRLAFCTIFLIPLPSIGQEQNGMLGDVTAHDKTGRIFACLADIETASQQLKAKRNAMVMIGSAVGDSGKGHVVSKKASYCCAIEPETNSAIYASSVYADSSLDYVEKWDMEIKNGNNFETRRLVNGYPQDLDVKPRLGEEPVDRSIKVIKIDPIQQGLALPSSLQLNGTPKNLASNFFLDAAELVDSQFDDDRNIVGRWRYEANGNMKMQIEVEVLFGKEFGFMPLRCKYFMTPSRGQAKTKLMSVTQVRWIKKDNLWLPTDMSSLSYNLSGGETHWNFKLAFAFEPDLPSESLVQPNLVDWRTPILQVVHAH
jgi:hypothetical protein